MKRHLIPIVTSVIVSFIMYSCNKDFYPVGETLMFDQTLQTKKTSIPVFTFQESVNRVQTNVQLHGQLGVINHPSFGNVNASIVSQLLIGNDIFFGNYRQVYENEDNPNDISLIPENETVKSVYLEIPFFSNTNDKDNDGVIDSLDNNPNDPNSNSDGDNLTDIVEFQSGLNPLNSDSDGDGILDHNDNENDNYDPDNKVYQIDSLYGNSNAQFNLQVHELTYYLNNLDSNNNFESAQAYYSNRDYYKEGFVGETLFNETISLNFDEIRINYEEDDPNTLDIDETNQVESRLSPRIRVPLDSNFFQERVLDLEGTEALLQSSVFHQMVRGLIIRTDNFSDDLYMLLDIQNAEIKIKYEYDDYNTRGTLEDLSDDIVERLQKEFSLRLGGNQINTIKNTSLDISLEGNVLSSSNNEPTDRLSIQSSNLHGKIRLFSVENPNLNFSLDEIRSQNLLINEANLIFYVHPETIKNNGLIAKRLYLYNDNSGASLSDYEADNSVSNSGINTNKQIFGGILELDEDNNPYRYKFNLTNHISNIIRNEGENHDLGLVVTGDIENPFVIKALKNPGLVEINYPVAATLNPLGAVLVGSHPNIELIDKKATLELIYSSY